MSKQSARAFVEKDAAEWEHDGWTSCPNAILRHPELPWELRAVWAWLASHTTTFELTAEKLRQAGPKGRDWAYSAIKELERWGLLTRHHEIAGGGQPIVRYRLHHRPVSEERRTFEPSKAMPRARRHPGTKERTPDPPGIRPELGVSDSPDLGGTPDPSGRRTPDGSGVPYKEEKTMEKNNQPGPGIAGGGEPGAASPGWLDGAPPQPQPQPPTPAAPGPGVRFLAELDVRHRPDQHAVRRLAPLVEALLAGDWSWDDLKRALTAGADLGNNPPGVVISRIEKLERESKAEHLSRSGLAERRKQAETERAAEDRRRAEVRALAIANCSMCDDIGYDGARLCDHNPAADEVRARGRERVQAVFAARAAQRVASPPTAS